MAILLVLVAILASLGMSSPKSAEMAAASIPRLGDLAPPPLPAAPIPPALSSPAPSANRPASLDGNATWYGKVLHGHRTASGERFDMFRFTAAHNSLPFGTVVKVTNKRNGRWVVVKITDRGILDPGRVIDLSYAAAKQLGMLKSGVESVHIEKIDPKLVAAKFGQTPATGRAKAQPVRQAKATPAQR